jgi:ABC-2 type transport system permease protein
MYLKIYFRTLVEYRMDTWIALIAGLLAQASALTFLSILFKQIPQLAGWSFYELLFIFGLASAGRELNKVFFNVPYSLTGIIRSGRLDTFLIRPVGPLFQAIGMSQEINGVGSALTSLSILAFAGYHLDLEWSVGKIAYVVLALFSSMLIQLSVLLALVISSFWIVEIRSIVYLAGWIYDFTRYPLDIFNSFIRGLLTFVIPFSLGSFYPATYLLRPETYAWAGWVVPLAALSALGLSYRLWLFGLSRYTSASG